MVFFLFTLHPLLYICVVNVITMNHLHVLSLHTRLNLDNSPSSHAFGAEGPGDGCCPDITRRSGFLQLHIVNWVSGLFQDLRVQCLLEPCGVRDDLGHSGIGWGASKAIPKGAWRNCGEFNKGQHARLLHTYSIFLTHGLKTKTLVKSEE